MITKTNLHNQLPEYTKAILHALNEAGHEAYAVGGAVRDLFLRRNPNDFDITTSAKPEEVLAICQAHNWGTVDQLGHNFGCVVIVIKGEPTEVTTFRGERYDDSDMHRPAETWYATTLQEDCARRDFTINAMAMDANGNVYDYFGGMDDLKARVLRTVGKSEDRYREDALRMLRACRFVAQLGFTYVQNEGQTGPVGMPDTPYYLEQGYVFPIERCKGLSLERVRKEMEKLLLAPYAGHGLMLMRATGLLGESCRSKANGSVIDVPILPEAMHLLGLHQNKKYHIYDTWEHTLLAIDNSPRDLAIRWALVLHDIGKGTEGVRTINKDDQPTDPGHEKVSAALAEPIMTRFGYDKKFVKLVTWLVREHMRFAPMLFTGERTLLRWVRSVATSKVFRDEKQMAEAYEKLVEVFLADMGATYARDNAKLMADGAELGAQVVQLARTAMPVTSGDLHIAGNDILEIVTKNEIRNAFDYLLGRVQSGNLPNERNALVHALRKKHERNPHE